MKSAVLCLLVVVAAVTAAPQREGAAYTKEAIKQAQSTHLIPKDAEIQKVRRNLLTFFLSEKHSEKHSGNIRSPLSYCTV